MVKSAFILFLSLSIILIFSCKEDLPELKEHNPKGILNQKQVGESARDLLSAEKYKHLEVEINYVEGYAPSQTAINNLKTFLTQRVNKPLGITFKYSSLVSPNKNTFTVNDIDLLEKANRTVFNRVDTIGVYFFFADGGYSADTENSKVLGIAYRNTSMALFEKTIQNYSGGLNQPERSKLETVVLNHEFCHILGLVNAGTAMQTIHQDTAHGKHCQKESCLMHYTVETGNVIANLLGAGMPQLDAECIKDLQANGGK
ncbi:hypothetical protein BH23BAC1_BH23BAC1_09070 [soil metagenome]